MAVGHYRNLHQITVIFHESDADCGKNKTIKTANYFQNFLWSIVGKWCTVNELCTRQGINDCVHPVLPYCMGAPHVRQAPSAPS